MKATLQQDFVSQNWTLTLPYSPTRHAITVDSINKCVEVYESKQHVKVGQPPMPIIMFCEFAS